MKIILSILLALTVSISFGQQTLEQAEKLIEEEKYNSAFELLENEDPENQNPEFAIKKTDIALNYFVQSISHQMFAFKDLEDDEDLIELRTSPGDQSFSLYSFPANEILDTLISQYPENYKLHRALGNFYYEVHLKYGADLLIDGQEVLSRMYEYCTQAAENSAADYLTYYCLGYYHTLREEYDQAVSGYLNSIEKDSTYATSHYNLSICYLYTDQSDKGVIHAVKAIDFYEDESYKADAARVAAVMYDEIENYEKALKYFHLSDKIQPDNYYTINQLLELQLELGLLEESRKSASDFFELDPKNPRISTDLVDIYLKTGQEEELISLFERKIEKYNDDKEILGNIYFHIGQFYLTKDDRQKAKENFSKARKNFEAVLEEDHYVFQVIDEVLNE